MFKFGFSSNKGYGENFVQDEPINDIEWLDSKEIKIDEIKVLSNVQNLLNYATGTNADCTFTCGPHRIQQVPYSEAKKFALSETIIAAETKHSDLIPGKYEGGLKVWECTRDISDYLLNCTQLDLRGKKVLDAGCGAGLLGVLALLQGAIRVVFQDYNHEVLELLTGPNIMLNVPNIDDSRVALYSGDWAAFVKRFKEQYKEELFDVILTAETIYNPSNYSKLHDLIASLLSPHGVCYLGGKSVYFGVGGSIHGFTEYVNGNSRLVAETCWSTSKGVSREILKITHSK